MSAAPRDLLIISYSFPPLNDIAARRYGYMVEHLEALGWRPWVLTARSRGELPQPLPDERLITFGSHEQKSARVGVDLPGPVRTVKDALERVRLTSVSRSVLTWYRDVRRGWPEIEPRLPEFDLVLASSGPSSALWLGRWLARRLDVPWVADFRDLAALRPYGRLAPAIALDRLIEARLVRTASGFVSVSRTWADMLAEAYGRPAAVVHNGWSERELALGRGEARPAEAPAEPGSYLYYAGRFYPDRMPATELILRALVDRPGLTFVVRSLGPPHIERKVVERAEALGVGDRVRLFPTCDPATVNADAAASLCTVVFEALDSREAWVRGALTGKLLPLVAMPRPVLAVGRADSEMGDVLERTRKGRLCSTATQVGEFLDAAAADELPPPDEKAIAGYSKREQAARLSAFLDDVRP